MTPAQLLNLIRPIREAELNCLLDSHRVEFNLLPKLGINDELDDELRFFPDELERNKGEDSLRIWQYPNQFSKYLVEISKHQIESYLEIGVRHGGSFIVTVEYLRRFNPGLHAVGVDIHRCSPLKVYRTLNPNITFMRTDSRSEDFKKRLATLGAIDLAFIDGDHSEEVCWSDFLTVKKHARMVAFHDIHNIDAPGVARVWSRVCREHPTEYWFHEFVEQYESLSQTGKFFMGIGLAVSR